MSDDTSGLSPSTDRMIHSRWRVTLENVRSNPGGALLVLVLVVLAAFPLLVADPTLQHVFIQVFFYATLAQAWNILGGYAGQLSLGQSIFVGAGAYTSTLLFVKAGVTPWIGLVGGMLVAMSLAILIGYPLFRLKGHYFAIATWLLTEIAQVLVINWAWASGAVGINLPFRGDSPVLFQFNSKAPFYYISFAIAVLAFVTTYLVEHTKPGYIFRAIKDDPEAASSLGVYILRYQLLAFMIYSAFSAAIGTFYAQYVLVIVPDTLLKIDMAVLAMLAAVLGGKGTLWGPLIGALILAPLAEYARILLGGQGRAISLAVYGFLIVSLAIYEPLGLMSLFRRIRRRI